jgi:hypothetical protein
MNFPRTSATPVLNNPPDTMYTAQTVITAELENPEKTSFGPTSLVSPTVISTKRATMSTRSFSVPKIMRAPAIMAKVRAISGVNDLTPFVNNSYIKNLDIG